MATKIYLGYPPENIKKWIKENYKPATKLTDPLCFTAEEPNATLSLHNASEFDNQVVFSYDKQNWSNYEFGSKITLANIGDKVYFRAADDIENQSFDGYYFDINNGKIAASGNLNTLLKADGSVIDLTGRDCCYAMMFRSCSSLTKAPELPATTMAKSCYRSMFENCISLTQAPELPATELAYGCYNYMFSYCTSLTQAPELPATELTNNCYSFMFWSCTSLTQAPELPATRLDDYCYSSMFEECISLTQAPELPATELAYGCYSCMFYNCTSLTQAPELPATRLDDYCYSGMFNGCTSLTQAPELPATTLAENCYYHMFNRCTSLTKAPSIAKINNTCYNMFYFANNLEEITFTHMTTDEVVIIANDACIGIPKGTVICYCTDGVVIFGADDDSSGSGS